MYKTQELQQQNTKAMQQILEQINSYITYRLFNRPLDLFLCIY